MFRYIDNYVESMRNVSVGAPSVSVFCYNFMPVVDWTRTELDFETESGAR